MKRLPSCLGFLSCLSLACFPGAQAQTSGDSGKTFGSHSPIPTITHPYYNRITGGFGPYPTGTVTPVYPVYGAPYAVPGGYFDTRVGGVNFRMWRAPSGYYYPWAQYGVSYPYIPPTIIVQQGTTAPAEPPVSTIFEDMDRFLTERKEKFSADDYLHLSRRLNDLSRKWQNINMATGGAVHSRDETIMRWDLGKLGEEIARRVRP